MKLAFVKFLLTGILVSALHIQCSSGSKLLSSGSELFSALGGNSALSSITNLLKTPGLDKLLGGVMKKPFTLLAPTNDAMQSLGADALTNLAKPENLTSLANMLKGQIIPGKKDANSLMQSGLKSAAGNAVDLGAAKLGNLISGDKFNIFPIDKILG
jgi:uncharacterized surface protein with fasciclin (FAS1) repeats